MSRTGRAIALGFMASCLIASVAHAQDSRVASAWLPPRDIPGGSTLVVPAQAQDAAGLMVRIDRLESQLRVQNGEIEQMQFQIKRLEDQLRKFQQDVDFRFQESGGKGAPPRAPTPPPGKRSELNENGYPVVAGPAGAPPTDLAPAPRVAAAGRAGRRGDAFDPDALPDAPGAPRPIGETPSPSAPLRATLPRGPIAAPAAAPDDVEDLADDSGAPMDISHGVNAPRSAVAGLNQQPLGAPGPAVPRIGGAEPIAPTAVALPPASPRDEFDAALETLKAGQFDSAEAAFRTFLQKHPRDRMAADATFYLGESFYKRSRPREAAEQYLKVSTDYEKSPRAPEALLKLGLSLQKLGAREQACAAYGEIGRKYTAASASIRATADRESKRSQC